MKVALAQLNYRIGDFDYNVEKIVSAAQKAKSQNADLVIFSELAVCGASPFDLLLRNEFINDCQKAVKNIAERCKNIPLIIGCPTVNNLGVGKKLFNSALFINNGEITTVNKTFMYDNGISCDSRYFEIDDEFKLISINDHKIAITIGHDLWNEQRMNDTDNEYSDNSSLLDVYTDQNPDFVVNIAAMPYAYSQNTENLNTISNNAKLYNTPIFYINQVGANCELVYDGNSAAFNQNGEIVCKCKSFEEDLKVFDTKDFDSKGEKIAQNDKIEEIFNAITLALRDYFEKLNFKKAVLGLSGGIDSAVVLAMAVNALGKENVHSILMPTSYSTSHSVDDALEMLKRTGSSYDIIAIEDLRKAFEQTMNPVFSGTKPGLAEENIQARLRGSILMAYSNKFGNIVLNTSNKSEEAVGYSTLYGDMNGAFSILGDVYKTDVYRLAKYINEHCGNIIPQNIIDKAPSAELRPDQKDQDSLPPYDVLDSILDCYMAKKMSRDELVASGFDSETVDFILKLVKRVEYKRYQGPPILRLSTTNFGHYQRIPLVAKY